MTEFDEQSFSDDQLIISDEIRNFLIETSRWSRFLSILGFVGLALLVILGLFISKFMGAFSELQDQAMPFSPAFLSFFYILIAAVYFFPILYLYRFSKKIKLALTNNDQYELNDAFNNLKSHYKFIGIFAIIMIVLYGIMFIFGFFAAVFANF